ncbi:MAG TPA: hypothetical protein VL524_02800, partial [Gemmatimonadaceae bacterium]|nr:hypothetical protein [Gemmatimonadaceae bacterium]
MPEHEAALDATRDSGASERRRGPDRRHDATAGRRVPRRGMAYWLGVAGRDLAIIVVAVGAIVFAVSRTHPIFANQPSVAEQLTQAVPVVKSVVAPTPRDTSRLAQLVASPQFERDRQAFAADLVKTGRMDQARADSVAYYAVRESYRDGIPPAVVFGVMLTENA